jgi:hypothetical protein
MDEPGLLSALPNEGFLAFPNRKRKGSAMNGGNSSGPSEVGSHFVRTEEDEFARAMTQQDGNDSADGASNVGGIEDPVP